jgi:diguanylate cyclase (GGDEF)-like protein
VLRVVIKLGSFDININSELHSLNAKDALILLYNNALGGICISFVASFVLAFSFGDSVTSDLKKSWWIVFNMLMLVRLVDALIWKFYLSKKEYDSGAAITRFSFASILTALCWSALPLLIFEQMSIVELATFFIFLSAFASGSSALFAANKYLAIVYGMILIAPISLFALLSAEEYHQLLGLVGLGYTVVIIIAGIRSGRFTQEAINAKNQHTCLVEQIEQEKIDTAQVNQDLKDTTTELNEVNASLESEVKKRTEKIYQLSSLDPLTGLMNRKAFTAELQKLTQKSVESDKPLALLFIDLDGFKNVNDTMGHPTGDRVLIEVTAKIKAFSDENKAGRWGGDEFLVALPYSDEETAKAIAKAIITSISQPFQVNSNELHLGAAIGIAMCPAHSDSATELIQLADLSMCEQKAIGSNQPRLFSADLKQKIEESQRLLNGLQHAIEKKQFYLCYQPIQCAKDNYSWSFEALLRWDFDGQFIGPDIFIPLAEKSGLIKEIGAWVLNRACMDANQWQHNQQAAVSVNVSIIQLMDDSFIRLLDNALRSSGLVPERLHLEITESVFVDNEKKIREQLDLIQARNIHVSIDDFGTGYSSLSQLQTLPVNYVKIDKAFVDNMENKGDAIIRATLFIARELNCKTIAEGVETKEQAMALSAMGVDFLQGYYFAKPMKNDDLIVWQNPISNSCS